MDRLFAAFVSFAIVVSASSVHGQEREQKQGGTAALRAKLLSLVKVRAESMSEAELEDAIKDAEAAIDRAKARREACLLYTSPSPRDQRGSRMPSSA